MQPVQRIGIMTSGGDSPGMNAAIRAIVRTAIHHKITPYGIMRGYQGMIDGDIRPLSTTDVSNILHRGGTMLKTARSKEFMTPEGRARAFESLKKHQIDALILIGGDGTMRGAQAFYETYAIPSIGLPGTIDNDLEGTDFTIGFDTAVNTAVWAIDKIRDTAEAHDRLFLVEVMGRDAGYIALNSGLACGAEYIFIPEQKELLDNVLNNLQHGRRLNKQSHIIVVAEGDEFGGARELGARIHERLPELEIRVSILGHIQRGGSPTCADRILASRLGYAAVEALRNGQSQQMAGIVNDEIHFTPFTACVKLQKPIAPDLLNMLHILGS